MARKKPIISPLGQWAYPGEVTIIPSSKITMKGVNYPVLGVDDLGNQQMMMPGGEYTFPGNYVTEIPQMGKGGLSQWFDEKWVDVKTGKTCGRSGKDKDGRPYPACRPSKRVNETTPKTTSEMSSAEKARFKREKTSGKRIDYNHKRRELGGENWLDQYQSGGLLSKDDYDLTTAPKRGDYLLPDINRPYYIDDAGERRTEYKIGINVDGKETLIPTVVGGRQLTEDEARDRYRKTGLHMGQFNTPEEADYAARLRTARYKMLEDPINFQANQFQVGGVRRPIYTSNPRDPRIGRYRDSLNLYKKGESDYASYLKTNKRLNIPSTSTLIQNNPYVYDGDTPAKIQPITSHRYWYNHNPDVISGTNIPSKTIKEWTDRYKKPVQPYIYKKPEVSPIYTSDLNDPRLRSYNDSMAAYNKTKYFLDNRIDKTVIKNPNDFFYETHTYNDYASLPETKKFKPYKAIGYDYTREFPLYKKPVQPYIYKKPEVISEVVDTPLSVAPIEPPVKKIGYNKPIIQQFNYMSNENKAKALQKYGSVGDIPFQGVDINQLKDGGWLDEFQVGGRAPMYTSNPNDPRLQRFNDSMSLSNSNFFIPSKDVFYRSNAQLNKSFAKDINQYGLVRDGVKQNKKQKLEYIKGIQPTGYDNFPNKSDYNKGLSTEILFPEPVQPIIYQPSLAVSNIDRDMYTPNGGMAREYNIGVTLQDGSKKAFRTEKEYQDWKAANNLDISKAKVSEGRGYSYNYPENKKYGGWLSKYQTAGEAPPKSVEEYTNQFNEEISSLKDWYEANRKRIGDTVPEAYLRNDLKNAKKEYGPQPDPENYNPAVSDWEYDNPRVTGVRSKYNPVTNTFNERYIPPAFPFNFPELKIGLDNSKNTEESAIGIPNSYTYTNSRVKNNSFVVPYSSDYNKQLKNKGYIKDQKISVDPTAIDLYTGKNDPSTIMSHETSHYLNKNNPEVFLFNRTKLAEMGITDTEGFNNYYSTTLNNDRKEDELLSDAYALKQDMRKKGFYDYTKGEKLTPKIWNKYKKEYPDNFIIDRFTPVFENQGKNNIEELYNRNNSTEGINNIETLNDNYNITDPFSPHLKNTKETPTFKTSDERIIHLLNEIVKNKDQDLNIAKYGGWLNKYQTGGWDNWTPNVGKPYMRTSPAGNAGYSDNTRVSGPDLNNRKAAEAAQYARRSEKNGDTFIKYAKSQINPYNWGVTDYTKSGTRAQAFNAARKAGEKEFMWNDERYNTRKDTDPIKYTGDNPNQEEYDKILRTQYPEFFKILNRGQNVGNISFEGFTDYYDDRAFIMKYPNFVSTGNSKIGVGKNPLSSQEFISNLIAETGHLKDKNLDANIFNPYTWKFLGDFTKGHAAYDIPGTAEYKAHRLIEPGAAMVAYGNLSPNDIKRIQKNLGVKEDGYFGETTYKALQNKYKDNEYIQEAIENNQILHQNLDNNPTFSRDTEMAKRYLRELNKEVPLKYYDRFKDFRKGRNPIDTDEEEIDGEEIDTHPLKVSDYTDAALLSTSGDNMNALLLQQALRKRGYNLPKSTTKYGDLDGKYGDETKNALLDWQNKNITKKQNGGWLNSYQIGGAENPTEWDPEIGSLQTLPIHKKRSWSEKLRGHINQFEKKIGLDPYNQRSDDFMEQWARRVNDATGGRDWYKQPNDASGPGGIATATMETIMAPFSAPQYATVYGATGKVQMPSEAMNIQNPYLAFLVDGTLDPTNVVGAGIVKNLGKGSLQNMFRSRMRGVRPTIQNSVDNIATPNISQSTSIPPVSWQAQELPGLHLKSTMTDGPISKIVEPKTGLVNVEQALGIIGKESGGVDKVALIKQSLGENIPKKMDYNDFRKTVQDQLIPLEKQFSTERSDYGIDRLGYAPGKFVTKEVDGKKIHTYESDYLDNQTILFSNKDKFGRGSGAHSNPDETLGHAHYLIDKGSPDVLTVTQIQSDAFQGTHRVMPKDAPDASKSQISLQRMEELQNRNKSVLNKMKTEGVDEAGVPVQDYQIKQFEDIVNAQENANLMKKAEIENFPQKSLLDKNHQERYLQELVDYAGKQDYLNKVRVPTSETAAKVQGYKPATQDRLGPNTRSILDKSNSFEEFFQLMSENDAEIINANEEQIKAIREIYDLYKSGTFTKPIYDPSHTTILKKYAEQPKTIKKLFGEEPKIVTDSKGNTWYEFDIPKKFKEGKGEIKAFSTIGGIGVAGAAASQLQEQKKGGQTSWLNKYK